MPAKNRNFNGCWTCRERKVKCDLARPRCLRCITSGLACKGYDIKLRWALQTGLRGVKMVAVGSHDDDEDSGTQRSSVDFVRYPRSMTYDTYAMLGRAIDAVDTALAANQGLHDVENGPFGAYKWLAASKIPEDPAEGDDLSQGQASWIHRELVDSARLSIVAIKGPDYIPRDQNMLHILYPKFFPNMDSDDWLVPQSFLQELMAPLGLDLMVRTTFRTLLRHLGSRQFSFLKLFWPENCWALVVIPHIHRLVGEYVCNYETWSGIYNDTFTPPQLVSNLKLTAVYLSLGMAAFSLARDHPLYLGVSLKLRKLCSTLLNSHLDDYDSNSDRFDSTQIEYETLLLLCIVLQVQFDSVFGVFENYNLAFAIGDYVVQNKLTGRPVPLLAAFVMHTFTMANIFFLSTQEVGAFNYSIDVSEYNKNYRDLSDNYDLIQGPRDDEDPSPVQTESPGLVPGSGLAALASDTPRKRRKVDLNILTVLSSPEPVVTREAVALLWGYTPQILDFFLRVIHLTNHKSTFRSRKVFPRNFPKICADMEDELNSFDVARFGLSDLPFRLELHELLYRNIKCLFFAVRVYFARLIKEAPLATYQHLIVACLDELDRVYLLSTRLAHSIKPPFFVVLICGSDAVSPALQQRVRNLWKSPHLGWANHWRAKQILYEVWKRREEGEDVSWMDLVREWDLVLYMG